MTGRGKKSTVIIAMIFVIAILIAVGVYFLREHEEKEYEGTLVRYEQLHC